MKTYILEFEENHRKHLKAIWGTEEDAITAAKDLSLGPYVYYVRVLETMHINTAIHGKVTGED